MSTARPCRPPRLRPDRPPVPTGHPAPTGAALARIFSFFPMDRTRPAVLDYSRNAQNSSSPSAWSSGPMGAARPQSRSLLNTRQVANSSSAAKSRHPRSHGNREAWPRVPHLQNGTSSGCWKIHALDEALANAGSYRLSWLINNAQFSAAAAKRPTRARRPPSISSEQIRGFPSASSPSNSTTTGCYILPDMTTFTPQTAGESHTALACELIARPSVAEDAGCSASSPATSRPSASSANASTAAAW